MSMPRRFGSLYVSEFVGPGAGVMAHAPASERDNRMPYAPGNAFTSLPLVRRIEACSMAIATFAVALLAKVYLFLKHEHRNWLRTLMTARVVSC